MEGGYLIMDNGKWIISFQLSVNSFEFSVCELRVTSCVV